MNRWFISDTHFSHANIMRYAGWPFESVREMDEKLVTNWNALVAPEDIIFLSFKISLNRYAGVTDS